MTPCRIRILEEEVANQIAAGEVVERPSSVVKELVENAVDAGATRITVEVEDGGKALIRVTDNGTGMTPQEAVLALQRHATSKITSAEDLAGVRTLGFRGEALPSIASVSRVMLMTRRMGELEGCRLEVEAGEIRTLEAAGTAEGTILAVQDLFYNTPARLKFLKSTRSELGQICDVLTRLALSHPQIAVRLIADGEEMLHSPGAADPLNAVAALFGKDTAKELVPVAHVREGLAVEGYVSGPRFTRPTRSGQHLFVNGRWIRSRALTHALDEAFRSSLPPGRFAFAVLHVEIDPALIDVNVHPTKSEVRFLREWEVHRAVSEAVRGALTVPGTSHSLLRQQTLRPEDLQGGSWLPPEPEASSDPFAVPNAGATPADSPNETAPAQPTLTGLAALTPETRPIAQLWNAYIIAEGPGGLLIIDQHLAHERILYERLLGAGEASPASRPLASPSTLQLSHSEALRVDALLPQLADVGFALEPFGRDAFVLRAAPECLQPGSELSTLREVVNELVGRTESEASAAGVVERVAAATACRAAVKKGSRLGFEELKRLLQDLAKTTNSAYCPHNCPISVELSYADLLRKFKRT